MTDQDEKLLLTDICARIPYGVMCDVDYYDEPLVLEGIPNTDTFLFCNGVIERYASQVRPHLRPMSRMTEEEREEERKLWNIVTTTRNDLHYLYTDFLLSHHFDYRGLIEKGLALEAPENMYKDE